MAACAGPVPMVFLALLLAAPAVLAPNPPPINWDDTHYLHRAACVTHALFEPALTSLGACLKLAVKAPLMGWLIWPWGPDAATAPGIGVAYVSLGIMTFGLVLVMAGVMLWLAIPRLLIALAFTSLALNPLLWLISGAYQGDTLMSLLVALLVLLVPLELVRPAPGLWSSLGRGLAWGAVVALGVMAKTSFGYFAVLMAPLLLWLRVTRAGPRAAALAVGAGLVPVVPVVVYHILWWHEVIDHVTDSAAGPIAKYTSYGLDFWGYLQWLALRSGLVWVPVALMVALAAVRLRRGASAKAAALPLPLRGVLVWPLVVLAGYLILTAASENHDIRYGLPFLVGLPFALAACTAGTSRAGPASAGTPGLLGAALVAILVSVVMTARPDLRYVREAGAVLAALPADRPVSLMIASDDSAINFETFRLAQQLELARYRHIAIDTLIYDEAYGHPVEEVVGRMGQADAVVLLKARIRKAPEWTNRHADRFRARLQALGARRDDAVSPYLELYRIR